MGRILILFLILLVHSRGEEGIRERYFPSEGGWWGSAMLSYKAQKSGSYGFWAPENNAFSATVVLSGKVPLGDGLALGLELAGWSDLGLKIADAPRVSESITPQASGGWRELSGAELSRASLEWRGGEGLVRFGRMALPKKLSPWLWSDRSAGVLDIVYDGVTVAWRQGPDRLWYGGWITRMVNGAEGTVIGEEKRLGLFFLSGAWSGGDREWIASAYWIPDSRHLRPGESLFRGHGEREWSLWLSGTGERGALLPGVQLAYVGGGAPGQRQTLAMALRWEWEWGAQLWRGTLAVTNGGDYSLKSAGTGVGSGAFWGSSISGEFGSDSVGSAMRLCRLDWERAVPDGKWYAGAALGDYDGEGVYRYRRAWAARLGRRFERKGFFGKLEYRYRHMEYSGGERRGRQRFRVDLGMRF